MSIAIRRLLGGLNDARSDPLLGSWLGGFRYPGGSGAIVPPDGASNGLRQNKDLLRCAFRDTSAEVHISDWLTRSAKPNV